LVAIILREPGYQKLLEKLQSASLAVVPAPSALETSIVLTLRLNRDGQSLLNDFLLESRMSIAPFTQAHLTYAMEAFLRFGKGRHPAGLNFGDCFSYATAKLAGQPLLCKGEDFAKTDIRLA
jgi:ribonuclease VapC